MTDIREYLHLAVLETDPQARILAANPAAENLLDSSRERLCGQTLAACMTLDEQHGEHWQTLLENSRSHPLIIRSGTLHLLKTRSEITVDLAIHAIPGARHLLTIDPMSRAQSIARIEERQRQAEHNRHIIKNLAHEIRNPLAGIRGAAQRLSGNASPAQQPYLDLIIAQVDRLNHLLTTLNGTHRPALRPHNIHRILETTLALFAADPANAQLRLIRHYDPGLPDIDIDDHQMQQVLLNLLQNAAKASDHHGDIHLSTAIRHQYTLNGHCHRHVLALSIEDHGCGIPDELHIAIFQPMISHFREGSGLGLAIVQNIIQQHGGAIELDSRPGHTRITLILPYHREQP